MIAALLAPEDAIVLGFLCLTMGPTLVMTLGVWLYVRRTRHRMMPTEPMLAETLPEVPGPFRLEIPAGPACTVMARYSVRGTGSKSRSYGVNVTLTALREPAAGSAKEPFAVQKALGFGTLAKQTAEGGSVSMSMSYHVERFAGELTHTNILLTLPAGGPAIVEGTIESKTQVSGCSVFAKDWT